MCVYVSVCAYACVYVLMGNFTQIYYELVLCKYVVLMYLFMCVYVFTCTPVCVFPVV